MRTNIVLNPKLIARAMKKAGVTTMRETIDIALREYVSKPDYEALLQLRGSDAVAADYDPKTGDRSRHALSEPGSRYTARKAGRRRLPR